MYSPDNPFYRHPDGSFRLDHYRAEALALRRAAMQDTSKLTSFFKLVAIVAVVVGMIAVAPPKNDSADDGVTASRSSSRTAASHAAPARPPVF